jgi:hypothetical protein
MFDSFLSDLNKNPVAQFDSKQLLEDVNLRFKTVLDEVDYQDLYEDNERSAATAREFLEMTTEMYPDTDPEINEANAKTSLAVMAMNESSILTSIRMTMFTVEYYIANGELDPDKITATKAKLYTDLLVKNNLDPQNTLLAVLNKSIPGPELEPEDPLLSPYFMQSMEEFANEEEKKKANRALVDEAYVFLGIDQNDTTGDNLSRVVSIAHIVVVSTMQLDTQNAVANREERIRSSARELSLDTEIAEGIIRFIELKFPSN